MVMPRSCSKYQLSLKQVFDAVARGNSNASGSLMNIGGERYVIRGLGLLKTIEDIEEILSSPRFTAPRSW